MSDRSSPDSLREVRRKAERMARARRSGQSFWSQLVHVGVLGWMFAIPVVIGAFLAHWIARRTGMRGVAIGVIVAGVVVGCYVVYRQVKRSLDDDDHPGDQEGEGK